MAAMPVFDTAVPIGGIPPQVTLSSGTFQRPPCLSGQEKRDTLIAFELGTYTVADINPARQGKPDETSSNAFTDPARLPVWRSLGLVGLAGLAAISPGLAVAWLSLTLIALAGLPHGASDHIAARALFRNGKGRTRIALFICAYLLLAAGYFLFWQTFPDLALVGFLVLAAWHFADTDLAGPAAMTDPGQQAGHGFLERLARGLMPIAGPAVFYTDQLGGYFAVLMPGLDGFVGQQLAMLLEPVGIAAIAAMALSAMSRLSFRQPGAAAELASLTAIALIAPPLASFALYFAFIHSPRHLALRQRQMKSTGIADYLKRTWIFYAGGIAVIAAIGLLASLDGLSLSPAMLTGVFIGLACLTVPHELLTRD